MKNLRQSIFLPVFALIVFLGFGAGTVLAEGSIEGVGGWNPEAVGAGQINFGVPSNQSGIDGSDDARFTSQATGSKSKRRAFVGTLAGITGETVSSITVDLQTSGGGDSQEIGLPGDPLIVSPEGTLDSEFIRTPGGPRAGTAKDGARVVVLAENIGGGGWTAIWLLVKPVRPDVPLNGVVVAVEGGEVTVETPNGDTEIVTLPEVAGDVTPGEVITVFRGHSGHAKGLVRAEQVRNRLKKFLDKAEKEVDEPEGDEGGKGNKHDKAAARAERIARFLERFSDRETRQLDRVMDRAPERVRVKLGRVRERIQAQRAKHLEHIERIRTKLDRLRPDHSKGKRPEDADRPRPDHSKGKRPEDADRPRPDHSNRDQNGDDSSSDDAPDLSQGSDEGDSTLSR